jgi:iron(III) transport system permease protein
MGGRRTQITILLAFFTLSMIYPLGHVLLRAFIINGTPSLQFFGIMLSSEYYRDVLCNSLNIAIAVTLISSIIAYPLALIMSRHALPAQSLLHSVLLLPLISPPFVGALGIRQVLSRFGSVNTALIDLGLISHPVQWLGGGGVVGIILLQTVHLVPILYLSISASLRNAHVSLEEAARIFGASRWQVLRRVVVPLSAPGWFAGASLVFIASFTDLGTPLIFDYRGVIPVQIYNMLSDLNENPVGYSFVVVTCVISLGLFLLSRSAVAEGSYAGSARTRQGRVLGYSGVPVTILTTSAVGLYALFACVPQLSVVIIASAKTWFLSVLPSEWTFAHFHGVLTHPITAHSLLTSLWLSVAASLVTMILGFQAAYIIARLRGTWPASLEILSLIPLAVPGIVFAFGYIGAYSGTILDNRINPFPLLLSAYSIRRLPAMVRSAHAGLQEANVALEEAAVVLGATPSVIARRIIFPLVSRHIVVGAILTFAYSMIEVSDSILLAMEVRFYPVSKAIYTLMGRPDGVELASALGTVVMLVMFAAFYGAEWFSTRADRKRAITALVALALIVPGVARAADDEVIAVTPHWEGIKEEFARGFAASYKAETGRSVSIRWLDIGGTSDIVKFLKTHHKVDPSNLGVDLIFGGGIDVMMELSRAGVLQAVTISPKILDRIPAHVSGVPLYSPQREWYTAALSIFGIIINTVAADKLNISHPTSWRDLGAPEYFDLIGIADPAKSGSMHAMFEVILQGYGWDEGWKLLTRIAANARTISNHASQVGKDVATGEMPLGIAIDTYAGDVIRQVGPGRVTFTIPSDYAAITGDGIALVSGAPHPEAGKRFIEFVLSEAGQKLWYYKRGAPGGPKEFEIGKLPVIPELYDTGSPATVVPGSPFTFTKVFPFDASTAAKRWNLVNDLYSTFVVEVHDRLVGFARLHPGAQPPTNPVSEEEARALSPDGAWGGDHVVRSRQLREWTSRAALRLPTYHGALYPYRWAPSLVLFGILSIVILKRLRNRRGR